MRAVPWIGGAVLVFVCCLAFMIWHRISFYEPLYGSTPQLSTLPGFVVGKWQQGIDSSKAKSKQLAAMATLLKPELDINNGGTFTYAVGMHRAKGSWKADARGVDLAVTSVDGTPADQVRADYKQLMDTASQGYNTQQLSSRQKRKVIGEGSSLDLAEHAKRLELYGNFKWLYEPGAYIQEDGSTLGGITIFRRLRD